MIIFLYGPDTFRSRRKLDQIKAKFIADIDKSALNIERLDGATIEANDFEQAISTPPFLARKRLVIVERLLASKQEKIKSSVAEAIITHTADDVIIVFWEAEIGSTKTRAKKKTSTTKTATKAPKVTPLLPLLLKEKFAQEFGLLDLAGVRRFATEEVTQRGLKIEPAALSLLVDLVGNDLWRLTTDLDKLAAYGQQRTVTGVDVTELVETKLEQDIFKLTDALGQKNKALAMKLINNQLANGTAPTELLSKITWQFKNLLVIKDFAQRNGDGYPPARLAFQLGMHPFVIRKTLAQASGYQFDDLKKSYRRLLEIDRTIKTSRIDPEVLFDLLVMKS